MLRLTPEGTIFDKVVLNLATKMKCWGLILSGVFFAATIWQRPVREELEGAFV
jgi:hypothetical protein